MHKPFLGCLAYFTTIQGVYNAKKFAKLVKKRSKLQNWLDYNQLKFERNPGKRPTKKVCCLLPSALKFFVIRKECGYGGISEFTLVCVSIFYTVTMFLSLRKDFLDFGVKGLIQLTSTNSKLKILMTK